MLTMIAGLKPFWRYYGGKWRAAPRYPSPKYRTIIEPFAGAAGYALRHPDRNVVLIDKYPVVAEMWRYLIGVSEAEVMALPLVDHVDDLPAGTPIGARYLVGFSLNSATVSPCRSLSAGARRLRALPGHGIYGWSEPMRHRVAVQLQHIRHWKIIEGDYRDAPNDRPATWFVDPPYNNQAGRYYIHADVDYEALAAWCRTLRGQAIVCENEGASWLPFKTLDTLRRGLNGAGSKEVIWCGA